MNKELAKKPFSQSEIDKIWGKALFISGIHDIYGFRKDMYGSVIQKSAYGDRKSSFGWEKDHYFPHSRGGADNISNYQPVNWQNNCKKSDRIPRF